MKVFVILSLAAVALAESDPLLYRTYGSSYLPGYTSYTGYTGVPSYTGVSSLYNQAYYPGYSTYNAAINPFYNRIFKRDTESNAESDPALVYTNTFGSGYLPYASTLYNRAAYVKPAVYSTGVYNTFPFNAYSAISPYYQAGRVFKREAESDPELVYTDGQFHTNLRNLNKGVHLNKALPYGSLYDVQKVQYVKPAVSYAYQPAVATYAAKPVVYSNPMVSSYAAYPGYHF